MDNMSTHLLQLYLKKINLTLGSTFKIQEKFDDIIIARNTTTDLLIDMDPYSTTILECSIKTNKAVRKIFINGSLPQVSQNIRGDNMTFAEGTIEVAQWSGFISDKDLKMLEDEKKFSISVFVKNIIIKNGTDVYLPQPGSTPLLMMFAQANLHPAPPLAPFNSAVPPPWSQPHHQTGLPPPNHLSGPPSGPPSGPSGPPSGPQSTQTSPGQQGQFQQNQQAADRAAALAAVAANSAHDRQIQAAQSEILKKNQEVLQLQKSLEDMRIQIETSKRQFNQELESQVRARMAQLAPLPVASLLTTPSSASTTPSGNTTTTATTTTTAATITPTVPAHSAAATTGAQGILPPDQVDLLRRTPLPDDEEFQTPMVQRKKKKRKINNQLSPAEEGEEEEEDDEDQEDEQEGEDSDGVFEKEDENSRRNSMFEDNPFGTQEILDGILEKIRVAIREGTQSDPENLVAAVQLLLPKINQRSELDLLSQYINQLADSIGQRENLSQSLKSKIRKLGHDILKVNKKFDEQERREAAAAAKTGAKKKILPTPSVLADNLNFD